MLLFFRVYEWLFSNLQQQHLVCTTLASTLYLILIRFLTRNYFEAFKLIETVFTDTDFDAEESWIFDQFERTMTDRHPEAHACRIKLSLAIMYSENVVKWDLGFELAEYFAKKPGVRAACRLRPQEEFSALSLAKNLTQQLKNRFLLLKPSYANQTKMCLDSNDRGGTDQINDSVSRAAQLKPNTLRWGGLPWAKVQTLTLDYVIRATQPLTRIQFRHPGQHPGKLDANEILGIIWDETLVSDEESGSNRQLGILFLYNLIRGAIRCKISGKDVTASCTTLLTRLFQLKIARWGEGTREGEADYVITKQMAMLASMIAAPDAMWPLVPNDPTSQLQLDRGINLYSEEGRMTEIKQWMDTADMVFRGVMTDPMKTILISSQIDEFSCIRKIEEQRTRLVSTTGLDDSLQTPLQLSNNSMASRSLRSFRIEMSIHDSNSQRSLRLDYTTIEEFAYRPLAKISSNRVSWETTEDPASEHSPFNLRSHTAASSSVSRELLERLDEDVQRFAKQHNSKKVPVFACMTLSTLKGALKQGILKQKLEEALEQVNEIISDLRELYNCDMLFTEEAYSFLEEKANLISFEYENEMDRRVFDIRRFIGQRPNISAQFIVASLMSSLGCEDLKQANPFIEDVSSIMALAAATTLHTNRCSFITGVLGRAETLYNQLRSLLSLDERLSSLPFETVTTRIKRIDQEQRQLALFLTSERHYFKRDSSSQDEKPCFWFDPRFLVGEYIFEILLRKRQVEIVTEMAQSALDHSSKVQQMIMVWLL